jgi:tRNA nucleotidyltransferase (CCA-adding enzyme)
VIAGTIRRLQLSAAQSGALEWAGEKTTRIADALSSAVTLRPSQVYRLLSQLPDEALALVLAKGFVSHDAGGVRRLARRLRRFVRHDRHVRSTISGEILKQFGLRPGPLFKKILDRLLDERLDGRFTAVSEEKTRARILAEQYG